jgi:hypothetical protein
MTTYVRMTVLLLAFTACGKVDNVVGAPSDAAPVADGAVVPSDAAPVADGAVVPSDAAPVADGAVVPSDAAPVADGAVTSSDAAPVACNPLTCDHCFNDVCYTPGQCTSAAECAAPIAGVAASCVGGQCGCGVAPGVSGSCRPGEICLSDGYVFVCYYPWWL